MEASELLKRIAEKNSIYGMGARQNINDSKLAHRFICECFNEISENPHGMRVHFGDDLVDDILEYIKSAAPCE